LSKNKHNFVKKKIIKEKFNVKNKTRKTPIEISLNLLRFN